MASSKNSNRRKRKYGDRKLITERNRKKRARQIEERHARLTARTQNLIGKHVAVRTKDHLKPLVGTVLEVVDKNHDSYPHEARRHVGRYLRVRTSIGELMASRHRTKVIRDETR